MRAQRADLDIRQNAVADKSPTSPPRRLPLSAADGGYLELLAADDVASKTVTAAWIPDGLDWKPFNDGLKRRGLVLAGGQGKLTGKIFRLGHLGSVTTDEILAAIGVIEAAAIEHGLDVRPGVAVAAAQQALVAAPVAVA